MKKLLLISIPVLALLFAGCSTSKITDSWATKQQLRSSENKILVLGLFSEKNRDAKRAMENELASDLRKFGYNAVTATETFGPVAFRDMNEQQALQKLRDNGIENVVTINLLNKDQQKKYVPGTAYPPYSPFYGFNRFWGYYSYYQPFAYNRGYYKNSTNYYFETNLYNVNSNELIYSAQTKSFDPSSMRTLANDYARNVVRDMKKKNVLG
ncbi:MAG: hypothetical protein ACTHJ5_06280 [Ilyomonas sp.]